MTLIELIHARHERRLDRIFATLGPRIGRQNDYRDFRVLEMVGWLRGGLRTFVTKGVGDLLLQQESGHPAMRQELAVTIASETNGEGGPAFLATIARSLIDVGRALPEKEILWWPVVRFLVSDRYEPEAFGG